MMGVILLSTVVAIVIASGLGAGLWLSAKGLSLLRPSDPAAQSDASPKRSSTSLLAGVVLAPPALALLAWCAILLPNPIAGCHCTEHGSHHLHLCLSHPFVAEALMVPALAMAAIWGLSAVFGLFKVLPDLIQGELWASRLRRLPIEFVDGVAVHIGDNWGMGAFTVGVWKPVIVVERALWERLPFHERRAVIHHEHAHVQRRDAFTFAVLRLANALTIGMTPWVRSWKAASEVVCDRHAALKLRDPDSVASALLSVERFRTTQVFQRRLSSALNIAESQVERRVHALLGLDPTGRVAPLTNDLGAAACAMLVLVVLIPVWPADALHHAVETLLGYLAR